MSITFLSLGWWAPHPTGMNAMQGREVASHSDATGPGCVGAALLTRVADCDGATVSCSATAMP